MGTLKKLRAQTSQKSPKEPSKIIKVQNGAAAPPPAPCPPPTAHPSKNALPCFQAVLQQLKLWLMSEPFNFEEVLRNHLHHNCHSPSLPPRDVSGILVPMHSLVHAACFNSTTTKQISIKKLKNTYCTYKKLVPKVSVVVLWLFTWHKEGSTLCT